MHSKIDSLRVSLNCFSIFDFMVRTVYLICCCYQDYNLLFNTGEDNDMKNLVKFCKLKGSKFGSDLLNYDAIDINMVKCFLDLSMPAISVRTYDHFKYFNSLSKVLTVAEEAFAVLVFESNFNRWVWQAEKDVLRRQRLENGTSIQDIDEDAPDLLYQKNIKKRKDNVLTAGKWTEEGLERYNDFITIIELRRQDADVFENDLKDLFVSDIPNDTYKKKEKKRSNDASQNEHPKKRVSVRNILNFMEL